MRFDEIPKWRQTIYQKRCEKCDYTMNVSTQRDDSPEYYTDVYIQCDCGNWVKFDLPVN